MQSKIVGLRKVQSRNLRAHLSLADFYLLVAELESEEEALKELEVVKAKLKESKRRYMSDPEVWSFKKTHFKSAYGVLLRASKKDIEKNHQQKVTEILDRKTSFLPADQLRRVIVSDY